VCKSLLIAGKEITTITLDEHHGAHSYLIHCSNVNHLKVTGAPVDLFFSSTLNTGTT